MSSIEPSHDRPNLTSSSQSVQQSHSAALVEGVLAGGGQMGELMRSRDWSQTPLGPIESWPQSLRSMVSVCLNSRFPILLWWGPELIMLYNDAYRPMLGITKHPQAMGQRGQEIWPEVWHIIGPMLEKVLRDGEATWSDDQHLLLDRNGFLEECYFTFSYSPIRAETGDIGGVFTAATETTRRVLGERRLRLLRELANQTANAKTIKEACALATQVLSACPEDVPFAAIYLLEREGRQARLIDTAGIEPDGVLNPEQIELELEDADLKPMEKALKTGKAVLVEDLIARFGNLGGDRHRQPAEVALLLPMTAEGSDQTTGAMIVGVSPQLALNDDYIGFFELMAGHVATAIANARAYEEERKRAEALAKLDRAKNIFFGNVSHEFRTPLTLMLGPAEDALADAVDPLGPQQRDRLETIHRNGLRLLKLVNTLLNFSQIEAGKIRATYEPTDLSTMTVELASAFESAVERAGLRLIINCPPLPEPIFVDQDMWEKIVLNLLSNALKFTVKGEIEISLQVQASRVELQVRDTGIGISADELPRIFERFYRAATPQGQTYEGTGIGLSLVQELVRLQGGTIAASSIEGQGSCFTVTVPRGAAHLPPDRVKITRTPTAAALRSTLLEGGDLWRWIPDASPYSEGGDRAIKPPVAPPAPVSTSASIVPSGSSVLSGKTLPRSAFRILLIDDNADMRNYIRRLLQSHYLVETAANGAIAWTLLQEDPPDLVLADVMMPELDGFQLLRNIRNHPEIHTLPVLLLSAREGENARVAGLSAGADDYLVKPFSARELLARIATILEMARLRQDAARREQDLRMEAESAKNQVTDVLESITDGFFAVDHEWRLTYVNQTAERLMGQPRANLLGQLIWDLPPYSTQSVFHEQMQQAVTKQIAVHFEAASADSRTWQEVHAYPRPDGLSIYWRDISNRKQAEEALRTREEQLRQLANAMPQIVWIANLDGEIEYLNQQWTNYTGMKRTPMLGRAQLLQAVHPEDRDITQEQWRHAVKYQTDYQLEYRLWSNQDQAYRWFLSRAIPAKDEQGRVQQWYGTCTDIDDRKRAEKAEQFLAIASSVLVSSLDYQTTLASLMRLVVPTLADYCFFDRVLPDEALERVVCQNRTSTPQGWVAQMQPFVPPRDRRIDPINEALRTGSVQYIPQVSEEWLQAVALNSDHLQVLRAGQITTWMTIPLVARDRKLGALTLCLTATSGRRYTHTDLAMAEELAARAALALDNAQLYRQAQEVNRIKDEFLAVLSHELRSPLNPILGWTKLLRTRKLDQATTDRALEVIERNAQLQTQLIGDLLDVSRILRGKLSLDIASISLVPVIEAAIETVQLAAEAKSIQIQTQLDPQVGFISGDAGRLQQVFWNLLSNAVKFTPEGGQVEVHLTQHYSTVQIQVRDTGKGIRPDFLPYVFDHFRQADSTTTRTFGGLGLGLAIVRNLVELHGGIVQVESAGEDQGATFTVRLPIAAIASHQGSDAAPTSALASAATSANGDPTNLSGLKILVVDDEADARDLLAEMLTCHGAIVITATSAKEALLMILQQQPDILLSDIGMPNQDGYELIRQVRRLSWSEGGKIPAIALTAYARKEDRNQALTNGFQAHFSKPVEPMRLMAAIANLATSVSD